MIITLVNFDFSVKFNPILNHKIVKGSTEVGREVCWDNLVSSKVSWIGGSVFVASRLCAPW